MGNTILGKLDTEANAHVIHHGYIDVSTPAHIYGLVVPSWPGNKREKVLNLVHGLVKLVCKFKPHLLEWTAAALQFFSWLTLKESDEGKFPQWIELVGVLLVIQLI